MGAMLSVERVRELMGADAEGLSDRECEEIARRAYALVRAAVETIQAERQARRETRC